MDRPLVTVFMPLYNAEDYIKEALESIIHQTYSNLEILIVDDGSTDQSVEIVQSYEDSRIRLVKNNGNKGIPYTRNVGLQEAKGKYMAIMDSDDIAHLNRIEKQVEYMENHPQIDAVGSFYEIFGGRFQRVFKSASIAPEEIKANLLFFSPIGNPTALVRLETIKKYNLSYNLEYFVAQDYDMWVQISKVGQLSIMPEVLLKYRWGHPNITKTTKEAKVLKRKKIIDSIHRDILEFYQFNLTEEELTIYNEFFNENPLQPLSEGTLLNIPKVLNKIVEQNRKNNDFNEEVLLRVMHKITVNALSDHKLSFPSKLNLYQRFRHLRSNQSTIKDMGYMVTKHLYKLLLAKN